MKLLGGIQSQFSAGAEPSKTEKADPPPRQTTTPVSTERHNVMADVISRHEQIVYRTKSKKT